MPQSRPQSRPRRMVAALAAAATITAMAAALSLPSTALRADESAAPAGADPAAEAEAPSLDAVVATVNGTDVTLGELILMRANLPEQYQSLPDEQLFNAMLDQATTQVLLADQAREEGFDKLPLARLRARVDARDFLAEARLRQMLAEATGEDAVRAAYDERVATMAPVQEVRASHILVADKALADEIYTKLQDGADFAALAKEHGTDGTKEQGGDLGWFEKSAMVPAFADAAFAAEEGVPTKPVQSRFGWHLILVTGKRDKPTPTYEEMHDEIAGDLLKEKAQATITEIRKGAVIVRNENGPVPSSIRRDDLILPN